MTTVVQALRKHAITYRPATPHLTDWFPYFSWGWVVVSARLPEDKWPAELHWINATDTEQRMFLLFVAEDLSESQ